MVKRRKEESDEEITSEEEENLGETDEFFEDPDEVRVRMARELLDKARETQTEDEIENMLSKTAVSFIELKSKGLIIESVADNYEVEEISVKFCKGHLLGVTSLGVSSDCSICVTGSKDCSLIIWDLERKEKLYVIKGFRNTKSERHSDEILAVAISTDKKYIASGGKDRLIKIWNGLDFTYRDTFKGHKDSVSSLVFFEETHTLFSGSMDRTIKQWDVDDRVFLDTLYGHKAGITQIDSLLNKRIISASVDCTICVWKIEEASHLVYTGNYMSVDCVRALSSSVYLAGGQEGSLKVWKAGKKKFTVQFENAHNGEWISAVAVLKGTDLSASGSSDGYIRVWKITNAFIEPKFEVEMKGYINALEFTYDGRQLIAGISANHKFGRWNPSAKAKPGIYIINLTS